MNLAAGHVASSVVKDYHARLRQALADAFALDGD
jgi:hypothetical protein